eukprot:COSAG06_NODE_17615_length_930_cov_1.368231_1_plen_58_part_10
MMIKDDGRPGDGHGLMPVQSRKLHWWMRAAVKKWRRSEELLASSCERTADHVRYEDNH